MSERDWAQESVTIAEEGKTRSPETILADSVRLDCPLDALPLQDRAFYRVVYKLDPAWEDIQYIADETEKSPQEVLTLIQAVYQKNARRVKSPAKLMEKIASAYSRLTELAVEEQALREKFHVLSYQQPVDRKQINEVTTKLQQISRRMTQLRALQQQWREESLRVLRIPSKEVAQIFNISVAAVDKRVEHIGRRVRKLKKGATDDTATD